MADRTLDGLLGEMTGVLLACTASEKLLLRQLQQLRLGEQGGRPAPAEPDSAPQSPPIEMSRPAATGAFGPDEVQPTWRASAASWPANSDRGPGNTADAKRDYNYFAELDEKLASLHQRMLDTRGT